VRGLLTRRGAHPTSRQVGARPIPAWVNRLAGTGAVIGHDD
jgi:hypothetical protein